MNVGSISGGVTFTINQAVISIGIIVWSIKFSIDTQFTIFFAILGLVKLIMISLFYCFQNKTNHLKKVILKGLTFCLVLVVPISVILWQGDYLPYLTIFICFSLIFDEILNKNRNEFRKNINEMRLLTFGMILDFYIPQKYGGKQVYYFYFDWNNFIPSVVINVILAPYIVILWRN